MMHKKKPTLFVIFLFINSISLANASLPENFVYLKDAVPSILQDIRYSAYHNFLGRPVKGYEANECILTKPTATALAKVQEELLRSDLSLKVYDCYRPQMAVDDFVSWSQHTSDQKMKMEFYPRVDKKDFFTAGYVSEKSGHTRGSTVDLTIVALPARQEANYHRGEKLTNCYAPYHERFKDNSINMGTGFDCFDTTAYPDNQTIGTVAFQNRQLLQTLMVKQGFLPYTYEWWHFTLREEPFPNKYFNFPITEDLSV
jgi:D-alanyl-D-alanine dipeptidase